jgi:ABC-type lipoprotein release transport system permease subunit
MIIDFDKKIFKIDYFLIKNWDILMKNKNLLNFAILSFYKNLNKNILHIVIFTTIIFISFSLIFVSDSLKYTSLNILKNKPDIIVQKMSSGKNTDTPILWIDEISNIAGINNITQRVYGKYWYEMNENYFTIIGIDFFDENVTKELQKIIKNIDLKEFLSRNNMIISTGVKKFFDYYEFDKYYTFRNPKREIVKVYIYDYLPKKLGIVANDVIIMDINLAKEILGINKDNCTDISISIQNPLEKENIKIELIKLHFNSRILDIDDIKKHNEHIFDYKNSIFIMIFAILFLTFLILIYQRYSFISNDEKSKILILRAIGYNIIDVIKVKILENLFIIFLSFSFGIIISLIYVFIINAPFLINIFLGFSNIELDIILYPFFDFYKISALILFFTIPFLTTIILPTWKISISEIETL